MNTQQATEKDRPLRKDSTPDLKRRLMNWRREAAGGPLADCAPISIAAIEYELEIRATLAKAAPDSKTPNQEITGAQRPVDRTLG